MSAGSRVPEADALRSLACAAVVLLHAVSASVGGAAAPPGTGGWTPAHSLYQLLLWATPTFAILSGFVLFLRHPDPPAALPFWRSRGLVVALPFVAWSLVYSLVFGAPREPLELGRSLLLGHAGQRHLYFLSMLLQFYALFPGLVALTRRVPLPRLLLPALGITAAYQVAFAYLPPGRPAWLWEFSHALLPAWVFYLVLGGVLARERERLRALVLGRPTVVALLAAGAAAALLAEYHVLPAAAREYTSHRPAVILYTLALLPALWRAGVWIGGTRLYPRARWLAGHSFAVYLVHPLALWIVVSALPAPGLASGFAPARTALHLALCWLVTLALVAAVKRLPHGGRLLGIAARRDAPLPEPRVRSTAPAPSPAVVGEDSPAAVGAV